MHRIISLFNTILSIDMSISIYNNKLTGPIPPQVDDISILEGDLTVGETKVLHIARILEICEQLERGGGISDGEDPLPEERLE